MATETSNKILDAGVAAPEFSLHSTPDQLVSLSDFRGAPLIVAFYPADWSPVCGDQVALYNEILPEFREYGAENFWDVCGRCGLCHSFLQRSYSAVGARPERAASFNLVACWQG